MNEIINFYDIDSRKFFIINQTTTLPERTLKSICIASLDSPTNLNYHKTIFDIELFCHRELEKNGN